MSQEDMSHYAAGVSYAQEKPSVIRFAFNTAMDILEIPFLLVWWLLQLGYYYAWRSVEGGGGGTSPSSSINSNNPNKSSSGVSFDPNTAANMCRCSNPDCTQAPKTESSLLRCSDCGNTIYCDAQCQKAHSAAHTKNCRTPEEEGSIVENKEKVWCMVLPCDRRIRPYAQLFDAKKIFVSVAEELFHDASLAKGASRGMSAKYVVRGQQGGCFIISCNDEMKSINMRASAMVTSLDGGMNLCVTEGAEVKVRGDAVLFHTPLKSPGLSNSDPMNYKVSPMEPYDLGYQFFDNNWGQFCFIAVSDSRASTTLLPNTPENAKNLADMMQAAMSQKKAQ